MPHYGLCVAVYSVGMVPVELCMVSDAALCFEHGITLSVYMLLKAVCKI